MPFDQSLERLGLSRLEIGGLVGIPHTGAAGIQSKQRSAENEYKKSTCKSHKQVTIRIDLFYKSKNGIIP